jgi:hypothetical protein
MDSVGVQSQVSVQSQQSTDEQEKIEEIQRIFNVGFEHVKGPKKWFNAQRIASLVDESEIAAIRQKIELTNDRWQRIDLARREVDILYDDKNTSTGASQTHRKAKDHLAQLVQVEELIGSGFPFPDAVLTELIRQADNGRKSVDYDDEKAKFIARKFNKAVADPGNSNDDVVITEKFTNPETIAIEKDIRR